MRLDHAQVLGGAVEVAGLKLKANKPALHLQADVTLAANASKRAKHQIAWVAP